MSSNVSDKYDVIIFGGGIAGMQSALDLADQDYKVAIIEKDASIGGKMISDGLRGKNKVSDHFSPLQKWLR